ncbi:glycosyltransferase [Acidobacteriia bacterium AH_259_A11_L15]|nr:glycosyltransferase [Acidobacteriia bacterium AH_259_A11_L15]
MPPFLIEPVRTFNHFVLVYFVLLNLSYAFLAILALAYIRSYRQRQGYSDLRATLQSGNTPAVSILVPAYNEENGIVECVKGLSLLHYPEFQIVVVNDGSTDGTLERLNWAFGLKRTLRRYPGGIPTKSVRCLYESTLVPNLVIVDKENGGKADALNAATNVALHPLVCSIDADSILEEGGLLRVVIPFVEHPNRTVAVGGIVGIANGNLIEKGKVVSICWPRPLLLRLQIVEYLRAFLAGRLGWSYLGGVVIISGVFCLVKKTALQECGGFNKETVGEDAELIVRLHRHLRERGEPYQILFIPDPICWTEAPESLALLARQRNRWQRGLCEILWTHRRMLFNPHYGIIGVLTLPFYLIFEGVGACVEFFGYAVFGLSVAFQVASPAFITAFLAVSVLAGTLISVSAILLEELMLRKYTRVADLPRMIWVCLVENFGYRQLHAYWRLRGVIDFLRGKHEWGQVAHQGFKPQK